MQPSRLPNSLLEMCPLSQGNPGTGTRYLSHSEIIRARTFDAFFPLIVISIIYFVLAWLFGKALDALAKAID